MVTYEVKEHIGVISRLQNGATKELNIVVFNDNEPKYDIRTWSRTESSERMYKGITLTEEELKTLYQILKQYYDG